MNAASSTALVPFQTDIKYSLPAYHGYNKVKRARHVIVRDLSRPEHEQEMRFLGYGPIGGNGEYSPTGKMIIRNTPGRLVDIKA